MSTTHTAPRSVLLVEDNGADAELFTEYLQAGTGKPSVSHVTSMSGALARLRLGSVDLVLLDLTLPDASGVDTVRRMRANLEQLPVLIVLTGATDERLAHQCIEAGASDYLLKSEIRPQSLRRAIGYALSRQQLLQAQKMEAVGHLAGGIAHDFNNLITVILANASALRETLPRDDERLEDLAQIMDAANRATGLTRQLLAFARRQPTQVRLIQLEELIAGVRDLLRRTLPENIALTMNTAPGVWPVLADPGQMEQVLINLAVNARDAMPNGGSITITVDNVDDAVTEPDWAGGPAVRLHIADTGEGIPPEHLASIFDPFFTTKAPGQGTGLGLATCYGIIQQAGGTISAESRRHEGTAFTILLPRAGGEAPPEPAARRRSFTKLEGTETLVVVEDDDSLRQAIVRVLRRFGYTVLAATNGEEGQRLIEAQQGPVDLIITDLIMPKRGGGELVDSLRLTRPNVKILCITGYALRPGDPTTGLREGVEVLYKPFEPIELLQRVREMLTPAG